MIFVSFGNAPAKQSFTRMAEAIDELGKVTEEKILVQTGNTLYDFYHVDTVKFLEHSEMLNVMKEASIVILQGGWGTISEAIMLGKKIISIPRRVGQECKHPQEEVVKFLERKGCLLGCYDTHELSLIIEKARNYEFKPLKRGDASKVINGFISFL
ncbi:glycosyltransferase [Coprobacter sp.]|uniref:glycosyltransferase n=1 Tax=Coprobacter sp. TaxID=1941478 RepID=UPI003AB6E506